MVRLASAPKRSGLGEREEMGDDPPQRSVIAEWPDCIDSARLPHSVCVGIGARCGHPAFIAQTANAGHSSEARGGRWSTR